MFRVGFGFWVQGIEVLGFGSVKISLGTVGLKLCLEEKVAGLGVQRPCLYNHTGMNLGAL